MANALDRIKADLERQKMQDIANRQRSYQVSITGSVTTMISPVLEDAPQQSSRTVQKPRDTAMHELLMAEMEADEEKP